MLLCTFNNKIHPSLFKQRVKFYLLISNLLSDRLLLLLCALQLSLDAKSSVHQESNMHSGVGWAEVRCKRGAMRTEDDSKWNKQGFQLPCPSCSCATSAAKLSAIPRRSLLFCPRYGVAVFVSRTTYIGMWMGPGSNRGLGDRTR